MTEHMTGPRRMGMNLWQEFTYHAESTKTIIGLVALHCHRVHTTVDQLQDFSAYIAVVIKY